MRIGNVRKEGRDEEKRKEWKRGEGGEMEGTDVRRSGEVGQREKRDAANAIVGKESLEKEEVRM